MRYRHALAALVVSGGLIGGVAAAAHADTPSSTAKTTTASSSSANDSTSSSGAEPASLPGSALTSSSMPDGHCTHTSNSGASKSSAT